MRCSWNTASGSPRARDPCCVEQAVNRSSQEECEGNRTDFLCRSHVLLVIYVRLEVSGLLSKQHSSTFSESPYRSKSGFAVDLRCDRTR